MPKISYVNISIIYWFLELLIGILEADKVPENKKPYFSDEKSEKSFELKQRRHTSN